jgi:hypothetical protein
MMKPVMPKSLFDEKKFRGKIAQALLQEKRRLIQLLNMTISTWDDPPKMVGNTAYKGGNPTVMAGPPDDGSFQSRKWMWLNQGTAVRYADLSSDWQSKTSPNVVHSGAGAGMVLRRGHDARRHKGIEARNWSTIIANMERDNFERLIYRAIQESLK